MRQQAAAVADLAGQQQGVHSQEVGKRAHTRQRLRLRQVRQALRLSLNTKQADHSITPLSRLQETDATSRCAFCRGAEKCLA